MRISPELKKLIEKYRCVKDTEGMSPAKVYKLVGENESRAGQISGLAATSRATRNPQPHLRIHDAGGHRNVYGGAGA